MIQVSIPSIRLSSGSLMPALGIGTWQLQGEECKNAVKAALKLGYTHIDTAYVYGNEKEIGEAILESRIDRKKLFIVTKVWRDQLHHDDVIRQCAESLRNLQTHYIDLYLIHWPNEKIPMAETFGALRELVDKGKIRNIGVSNFEVRHLEKASAVSGIPIRVNQIEFHPYRNQQNLLDYCKVQEIAVTAYSPLARGKILDDKTIKDIAVKRRKTPSQICLRWLYQKGMVIIPKATLKERIRENMIIFDWQLSDAEMARIDGISRQPLQRAMHIIRRGYRLAEDIRRKMRS